MLGHLSGLQTLVREKGSRVLYFHCRAHNLNLVAQDSVENQTEIRNTMNIVQKFLAFPRGSPKRLTCFNSFQLEGGTSLRPFCPNRWILRKPAIASITSNYEGILNWLEHFGEQRKIEKQAQEANGVFEVQNKFDTFLKLELLQLIFTVFEDSNTALQGNDKLKILN